MKNKLVVLAAFLLLSGCLGIDPVATRAALDAMKVSTQENIKDQELELIERAPTEALLMKSNRDTLLAEFFNETAKDIMLTSNPESLRPEFVAYFGRVESLIAAYDEPYLVWAARAKERVARDRAHLTKIDKLSAKLAPVKETTDAPQ